MNWGAPAPALIFFLACTSAFAGAPETAFETSLLNAIRRAEANPNYGILSVKCSGEASCRAVCLNTIRAQYRRFAEERKIDFIKSLGKRYAPIGAENDPRGLNENWATNVIKISKGGTK